MKNYHIPIFVPHLGCPHNCVFCNQGHITGSDCTATPESAKQIIDEHLQTIPHDDARIEIAFFGGSFTAIEPSRQTELLNAAVPYVLSGKVSSVRCSTRPDCIDEKTVDNLKKHFVSCVELGVQSSDEEVLRLSERGHTFEDVKKASALIKRAGISLGLQMMIGLPGDTLPKAIKTARDLIALKPACVRIYPTLVVENTKLCEMYLRGEYAPLTVREAAQWLSVIMPMFSRARIDIIRVGLQTTDEINSRTVKGPYHPALREIAESLIIRAAVEKECDPKDGIIAVRCPARLFSKVIGHKKCNVDWFKAEYGAKLEVRTDDDLDEDRIEICGKIVDIYA